MTRTRARVGGGGHIGPATPARWIRAVRYALLRYVARREFLVATEPRFGLRFRFATPDVIGRHIFKRGVHEGGLTRVVLAHVRLRPGDAVVDVGANLGWYSMLLDRIAPDDVRIVAFEPEPLNFRLLVENVGMNGARVTPVAAALSDRDESLPLHVYPGRNRGRHSFLRIEGAPTVEVAATTLDGYLARERLDDRRVGFLKIDVEGFEHRVLRGAAAALARTAMLLTEFAPDALRRAGTDPRAMIELLEANALEAHRIATGDRLEPVDRAGLERLGGTSNLVWLRRNTGESK